MNAQVNTLTKSSRGQPISKHFQSINTPRISLNNSKQKCLRTKIHPTRSTVKKLSKDSNCGLNEQPHCPQAITLEFTKHWQSISHHPKTHEPRFLQHPHTLYKVVMISSNSSLKWWTWQSPTCTHTIDGIQSGPSYWKKIQATHKLTDSQPSTCMRPIITYYSSGLYHKDL